MKKIQILILLAALIACAVAASKKTLQIYFIDVEGGAATLIVTPQAESVLVDTGWPREDRRDATRIFQVARQAGLRQIDHLVTTHFHTDHYGGILALSQMIPISNFYDHGPMTTLAEDKKFAILYADYLKATGGRQVQLQPGDTIALKSNKKVPLALRCVSSDRQSLQAPVGSVENRLCGDLDPQPEDPSDNAASVGLHLRYGAFDFLDLGDLTRAVEARLVCPYNVLGAIDAFQVTHHGNKASNLPILVESIRPTVAIVNNGPRKAGDAEVFTTLKSTLSLKDIFQLHRNLGTAEWENTQPEYIANLGPEEGCNGYGMRLVVDEKAKFFTVANERPDSGLRAIRYAVK